jgi:hypothetical protein
MQEGMSIAALPFPSKAYLQIILWSKLTSWREIGLIQPRKSAWKNRPVFKGIAVSPFRTSNQMQRRAAASNPTGGSSIPFLPSKNLSVKRGDAHKKRKWNPALVMIGFAILTMSISWQFFPDEAIMVEHEAEAMGHRMAERAMQAEHNVEDWIQNHNGASPADRAASDAASQAMLGQSSKWVDGEKKLKRKLMGLYETQQKGELLGVPVLTRWLGDDFPAWVTPDMDEKKWRDDVAAKYKEMREEEEDWKKQMQKIIDRREQELGLSISRP